LRTPVHTESTQFSVHHAMTWRVKSDAGSAFDDSKPPEQRSGVLWDAYRRFQAAGMKVDAASYTTAFRAKATSAALESTLQDLVLSLPAGVLIEQYNYVPTMVWPARRPGCHGFLCSTCCGLLRFWR
jgi:hypothetical protein